jgi:ABC-type branched-subunit amino acid transport system substrate-binding protein
MPILQPEDGGVTSSPGMLNNLGKAAIGTVFGTAYLYNANTPGNKEFVDAYQKKYKELPGVMSGVGYMHIQLIIAALKANGGNTKPDALYKAIKGVSVDTVRGHLSFPAGQGGFGNIANYPNLMGKIGPDFEVVPILPVYDIRVNFKNGKWLPYVAK